MSNYSLNTTVVLTGRLLGADVGQGSDGPAARGGGISLLAVEPISASTAGTRHWGGAVAGGHGIGTCLRGHRERERDLLNLDRTKPPKAAANFRGIILQKKRCFMTNSVSNYTTKDNVHVSKLR